MVTRRRQVRLLLLIGVVLHSACALSLSQNAAPPKSPARIVPRRAFVASILAVAVSSAVASPAVAAPTPGQVTVELQSPGDKVGLELYNVMIGNPSRPVVAIRRIAAANSNNRYLQPGMVLRDYASAANVQDRLRSGPYPVQLKFSNLAAAGDAFSDTGSSLVTSQDALTLARQTSSSENDAAASSTDSKQQPAFAVTTLRAPAAQCKIQSRRNDVLEIVYEAHEQDANGRIYDSSITRGTGQPYQMVLGSGDMVPGVDQGLYDMCPGTVRALQIPPALGYGPRAAGVFGIPAGQSLYWTVELVSVNGVKEGDTRTRAEMEGRY